MYAELYEVWKRERINSELQELPPQFYARVADYLKHLREEGRMLDKKTVRARLLKTEHENVRRMLREIAELRYSKIIRKMSHEGEAPSTMLAEEEKTCETLLSCSEKHRNFIEEVLRGHLPESSTEQNHQAEVLRFIKDVPAVIGADMKTYGPFRAEDVASLPKANSTILIKQGLAERVEIK